MPRRDSRAHLIHKLAKRETRILEESQSQFLHPAELYDNYRRFALGQLKMMAAGMSPSVRGRPEKWTKFFGDAKLISRVKRIVRKRGISVSAACLAIAKQGHFGSTSEGAIKQRYYRALRRQAARRRDPI